MFSPRLSVLLVSEALVIYIVKFVNRQVRQSVWCTGSVILFFFFFFFFFFSYGQSSQNNEISNVLFFIN